jgi:alkyl sulfatase BDS1-like metallo-beta-lactamase superfamily hydrolase
VRMLILGRGDGKTKQAVQICASEGFNLVCMDRKRAKEVFDYAKSIGLNISYPLTFEDFIRRDFPFQSRGFVIDDADMLLQKLAGKIPVRIATFTGEQPLLTRKTAEPATTLQATIQETIEDEPDVFAD